MVNCFNSSLSIAYTIIGCSARSVCVCVCVCVLVTANGTCEIRSLCHTTTTACVRLSVCRVQRTWWSEQT